MTVVIVLDYRHRTERHPIDLAVALLLEWAFEYGLLIHKFYTFIHERQNMTSKTNGDAQEMQHRRHMIPELTGPIHTWSISIVVFSHRRLGVLSIDRRTFPRYKSLQTVGSLLFLFVFLDRKPASVSGL